MPRLFPQQTSDGFGVGGALVGGGVGGGNVVVPRVTITITTTTACKVCVSLTTLAISEAYIAFVTRMQTTSTLTTR